jgi:hypothetical protein
VSSLRGASVFAEWWTGEISRSSGEKLIFLRRISLCICHIGRVCDRQSRKKNPVLRSIVQFFLLGFVASLMQCVAAATNDAKPGTSFVRDEARIFAKNPEIRENMERAFAKLALEHRFHCYFVTRKDLVGENISIVARSLCHEIVGERAGCLFLYEESTTHLHLSPPVNSVRADSNDPLVSPQWIEKEFLQLSEKIAADNPGITPDEYCSGVAHGMVALLQKELMPAPRERSWKSLWIALVMLVLGFLLWWVMARRNERELAQLRLEYSFPLSSNPSRLLAKCGGGVQSARSWSEQPAALLTSEQTEDYFLHASISQTTGRKKLIGKAMIFDLLCRIHNGEVKEEHVCRKYELTPRFLAKWREHFGPQLELSHKEEIVKDIKHALSSMIDEKISVLRAGIDDDSEHDPSAEMIAMIKSALAEVLRDKMHAQKIHPDQLNVLEERDARDELEKTEPKTLPVMPI